MSPGSANTIQSGLSVPSARPRPRARHWNRDRALVTALNNKEA